MRVWQADLRRTTSRAALRTALGRTLDVRPDSLTFAEGPGGRPELVESDVPVSFNLSHSGDLCLIAISTDGPVGIDVEEMRAVPELASLVRARFAASEADAILAEPEEGRLRAFYRCWTRKEAYLKATGAGIGAGIDGVVVSVGERPELISAPGARPGDWALADLALDERFAGALAHPSSTARHPTSLTPEKISTGT